jgi:hypothetical protein
MKIKTYHKSYSTYKAVGQADRLVYFDGEAVQIYDKYVYDKWESRCDYIAHFVLYDYEIH